jgi:phage baseplate assembly protein gpV
MSVDQLLTMIQRVVHQEMTAQRSNLLGVVTEIFAHEAENDENNYEVNVRLKHEDLELRRVPIAVAHIGIAVPPRVGDLVLVQFIHGDLNQPVVTGRFYHADDRPPLHKADDILFEHRVPGGKLSHLRFASDGTIYIQSDVTKPEDNSEATASIKIEPNGMITIKCDTLTIDGKLHVKQDSTFDTQVEVGQGPKTAITGGTIEGK